MFPTISPDPNLISVRQEQFERQELDCRIRCAALDTVQRETIALVIGIAQAQLTIVNDFLNEPVASRDFHMLVPRLRDQLSAIQNDIVEDYKSLLGARECYLDEGRLITLDATVRTSLLSKFQASLTEIFTKSLQEISCTDTGSLERLRETLEKRIKIKADLADTVLDGKTRITEEMHDILRQRDACAKMRRALLAKTPTDIWTACEVGATSVIQAEIKKQWFYNRKVFVNTAHSTGLAPLHIAAFNCHAQAVAILLKYGANPAMPDSNTYTALHWAAKSGSVPSMQQLLARNAPIDARGEYGRAPLHMSVFNGHDQATICLLNNGADINAQTDKSDQLKTPLHDAVMAGNESIVNILTKYRKLNVNCVDKLGWTPLRHAVEAGHVTIAALILQHHSWKAPEDSENPNHIEQLLKLTPRENAADIQRLLKDFYLGTNQRRTSSIVDITPAAAAAEIVSALESSASTPLSSAMDMQTITALMENTSI